MLADRYLLIGAPAAVAERLAQFATAGVDTVLIRVAAVSTEHRSRIVETFASRVLPIVRNL
jgi:alkanesulfonate monooxygenase SsuD/methylene tetrahydromethanopterin reductase-like flavin-dependent oxidoreductase (luciferase family)